MTDLKPDQTPAQTLVATSPGGDDPLSHLHKMSRTAGLGTTEYVAVNGVAVVTLILGVASSLSLFDPVLLAIPVAALVLAVIAFRQVSASNGTQTGKGLTILGLLLALLFTGMVGGRELMDSINNRNDEKAIDDVIAQLSQTVRAAKYDQTWQLFSSKFTSKVKQQVFNDTWSQITKGSPQYGGLSDMRSNGHLAFEVNADTQQKSAVGMTIFKFGPNAPEQRIDMVFKQMPDGTWKIDDIPLIFPTAPPAPPKAR